MGILKEHEWKYVERLLGRSREMPHCRSKVNKPVVMRDEDYNFNVFSDVLRCHGPADVHRKDWLIEPSEISRYGSNMVFWDR